MKVCLHCGSEIKGRSDKKYCDRYCRNSYNNQNISQLHTLINSTNSIIRKNRTILKTASPQGKTTVRKEYLDMQGFDFRYFTSVYRTKSGNLYRLCYDYGFTPVDDNKVLIINVQDYMQKNPSHLERLN